MTVVKGTKAADGADVLSMLHPLWQARSEQGAAEGMTTSGIDDGTHGLVSSAPPPSLSTLAQIEAEKLVDIERVKYDFFKWQVCVRESVLPGCLTSGTLCFSREGEVRSIERGGVPHRERVDQRKMTKLFVSVAKEESEHVSRVKACIAMLGDILSSIELVGGIGQGSFREREMLMRERREREKDLEEEERLRREEEEYEEEEEEELEGSFIDRQQSSRLSTGLHDGEERSDDDDLHYFDPGDFRYYPHEAGIWNELVKRSGKEGQGFEAGISATSFLSPSANLTASQITEEVLSDHQAKAVAKQRQHLDYLAPFLPATYKKDKNGMYPELSYEEAKRTAMDCLTACRDRLVEKANILQKRIDKEKTLVERRNTSFRKGSHVGGIVADTNHVEASKHSDLRLKILGARVKEHEELTKKEYDELTDRLKKDPRLKMLIWE
eukprot:gnl/Carplike_NY0171/5394_a7366_273.p1 GENE.gnl/Carplike_NY0171/5394_a7366_273~~gnl/Carplike_NY0171/5394_a7366_273.p1  ORF type:complete len:439 (+),score=161.71 gnl/Carplike_NY0171/5394_a7366_273:146-1462(+)